MNSLNTEFGTVFFSKEWGSNTNNNRLSLRKSLFKKTNDPIFLDLQKKRPANFVSISHCKEIGGYYVNENLTNSGLDIESLQRVNESLISRISSDEEQLLLKDQLPYIWLIKEAGFKAFSNEIHLMSDIIITEANNNSGAKNSIRGRIKLKGHSTEGVFLAGSLNSNHLFAIVLNNEK